MAQITIDDVVSLTTPQAMMQAIDGNFDELYASLFSGADNTDHFHAADRDRSNHTGTQPASTIYDFDSSVSANSSVAANTAKETNVDTNLSFSQTGTTVTVESSDGSDAEIPAATTLLAGVMSAEDKVTLQTASASYTNPWV